MEYTGYGITEVTAGGTTNAYLPGILNGKKSNSKILASLKAIEKTIGSWYKNTLKEIYGLPKETVELLKEQYRSLVNAQLQLQHL